jgi:hypothetical protein
METFVAFAVGVGNLGRQGKPRKRMSLWVEELNQLLLKSSQTTILSSYGHTGNFIVRSVGSRACLAAELGNSMGVPCAVLTIAELSNVVKQLGTQDEADSTQYRRTPGAAFLVSGTPTSRTLSDTERARYCRVNGSVVAIRKHDALTSRGILDRARRAGGWGAIAGEIGRQLGGKWTARSMRTLSGILERAQGARSSS